MVLIAPSGTGGVLDFEPVSIARGLRDGDFIVQFVFFIEKQ